MIPLINQIFFSFYIAFIFYKELKIASLQPYALLFRLHDFKPVASPKIFKVLAAYVFFFTRLKRGKKCALLRYPFSSFFMTNFICSSLAVFGAVRIASPFGLTFKVIFFTSFLIIFTSFNIKAYLYSTDSLVNFLLLIDRNAVFVLDIPKGILHRACYLIFYVFIFVPFRFF